MIKDSGKKLFDVVLVWKFDRFARNRFDSANYKMILKKNGRWKSGYVTGRAGTDVYYNTKGV